MAVGVARLVGGPQSDIPARKHVIPKVEMCALEIRVGG